MTVVLGLGAEVSRESPRSNLAVIAAMVSGDTVRLRDGRAVRLAGIDAPDGGRCHAWRARRELALLLPPRSVVALRGIAARDHGRGVTAELVRRGVSANAVMVARGAAAPLSRGDPTRLDKRLLRRAVVARRARRGAWANCRALLDPTSLWLTVRRQPDRERPNWGR